MDISVVVPVFNARSKLRRCISALGRQRTERSFEIIVVNDGSTDGSFRQIQGNNIRVVSQTNQGPAAARNLGVEKAKGKIVLFTDADCEPLENWIEEMVRPLEEPLVFGVKGSYLTRQEELVARFVQLEYEAKYERMKRDRYIDFVDTYAAAFKKQAFLTVGGFDTRFPTASVEDQELSFRMWEKGYRMIFNSEAKVFHAHVNGLLDYMKKKFKIGYWKALVLRRHPKKILRDSHTPQTLKFEMVFSSLFLVFITLALFKGEFLVPAFLSAAGFLTMISPFCLKTLKRDPMVGLFSPLILFFRALSLTTGLLSGSLKMILQNEKLEREYDEKSGTLSAK